MYQAQILPALFIFWPEKSMLFNKLGERQELPVRYKTGFKNVKQVTNNS
jgi:hypothetical protein